MIKMLVAAIVLFIISIDSAFSANEVDRQVIGGCGGSSPWVEKLAGMIEPVLDKCSEASSVDEFVNCGVESLGIDSEVASHVLMHEIRTILTDTLATALSASTTDDVTSDDDSPAAFKCPCLENKMKTKDEL